MLQINFRYLILEDIFNELTDLAKKGHEDNDRIVSGWIFADRTDNFAIIKNYKIEQEDAQSHIRPKSWMRIKKRKLWQMRKLKKDLGVDILWKFHTHPDGKEELHEIDEAILDYLTTGVMIIVTPENILGWYFNKRETKKPYKEKMYIEIISEE